MSISIQAPDLTQRPPRSPRCRLGGLVILPRMFDKGRATAIGKQGEYHYNCPLDQHLLNYLGIDPDALMAEIRPARVTVNCWNGFWRTPSITGLLGKSTSGRASKTNGGRTATPNRFSSLRRGGVLSVRRAEISKD